MRSRFHMSTERPFRCIFRFVLDSLDFPLSVQNHLLGDEWQGSEATPSKRARNENQNESFLLTLADEEDMDVLQQKTLEILQVAFCPILSMGFFPNALS